ncbi:MAG: ABC transporter permease [Anaerolineae bacterium]
MSAARTLAIMRKEFLHIIRDPRTLVLIFIIPIIQMILLGYAATTDIENIAIAVLDADHSRESRALIRSFEATGYFDVRYYPGSEQEMARLLDHGDVHGALIIPTAYGEHMLSGQHVEVGFIVDGSDPTVANAILAAALQTGMAPLRRAAETIAGGLEVRPSVWYNPGLESVNFMIPALMGLILQFLATLVTSMAIVREREYGTMEQIIVTPIRPAELIIGKTAPYVLLSFFDFLEVLAIGVLWFHVPIHGSIGLLMALAALFLVGSLALGIVISTVAGTQQEAMLMSFLILMPSIFLSGFFFPLDAMPWTLRALSYAVPLRYMLSIVRGIVLKGVGAALLWQEIVILSIFCVVVLGIAARRFRKSLD